MQDRLLHRITHCQERIIDITKYQKPRVFYEGASMERRDFEVYAGHRRPLLKASPNLANTSPFHGVNYFGGELIKKAGDRREHETWLDSIRSNR